MDINLLTIFTVMWLGLITHIVHFLVFAFPAIWLASLLGKIPKFV